MEHISAELRNFMHNVAWLRMEHGLSKREMAKRLGVSVGTLNKLEHGQFPPQLHITVLYNIQRGFGISVSEQFRDLTQAENPAPSDEGAVSAAGTD